jgi:leucyl-tRNA synthetase
MELINELYSLESNLSPASLREVLKTTTLMLAPFAPYTAQDLWNTLGGATAVFREPWPPFDPALAKEDLAEIVVQVNGKVRGRVQAPFGAPQDDVKKLALDNDKIQPFLERKQIVKTIVVPDKLVNIVVR